MNNIKNLAQKLQKEIDAKLSEFNTLGAEGKELLRQQDTLNKKMAVIVKELEPVHAIIFAQHPKLEGFFKTLEKYNTSQMSVCRDCEEEFLDIDNTGFCSLACERLYEEEEEE